jgi:hypothetical protein
MTISPALPALVVTVYNEWFIGAINFLCRWSAYYTAAFSVSARKVNQTERPESVSLKTIDRQEQ